MAGHTTSITLQRIEPKKRGLDALTQSRINLHSIKNTLQQSEEIDGRLQDYSTTVNTTTNTSSCRNRAHAAQDCSSSAAAAAMQEIVCLKTMLQILSLEDSCSLLSREIDLRTLASINDDNERKENDDDDTRNNSICLKTTTTTTTTTAEEGARATTTDDDDNIQGFISPASQICMSAIRNSWKWIARLAKCISIHLENSANYHQFFVEFSENERWMREDLIRIQRIYERHESGADYSDALRLIDELQRVGVALKQWRSKVDRMWTTAQTLVPVDLRTRDVIHEAIPARALCHFATNEIEFFEDEDLLLLDANPPSPPLPPPSPPPSFPPPLLPPSLPSSPRRDPSTAACLTRWRLSNGRGQTGEAPSVIILIPGIDPKAIHAAVQLRLALLAEWTDILKTSGRHLMAFLLNVFKAEYTVHEMETLKMMPEGDKQELLRLLSSIEDVLRCIWPEHNDFISLQQRIAMLRMMLQDQQQQQQMLGLRRLKYPTGSTLVPSIVVQIDALQRLLDAFQTNMVLPLRDLWESWNVIRISPQLNGHPEIQELIEKWERQQTANRVFFASFWRSETPIYEMERTLADLYRFQIAGIILQSPDAKALTTTYAPTQSTEEEEEEEEESSGCDRRNNSCGLLQLELQLPSPDSACHTENDGMDDDDGSDFGIGTETRTAQTEQYSSTESEERKRFVIRSVIHPENGQEISLHEAVEKGVIRHANGTYVNPATAEAKPIQVAMKEGLINVMFTTTKRSKEKKSSIGVITVKTVREQTRPYRVQCVLDTRTGKEMTREEAVDRNVIDERHGTYLNRQTGRKMLIAEAVDLGLVSVEYSAGDVPSDPDVISCTYAVHGVVDRARQKVVTFLDAMRRGIVDRETGTYRDTLTGQRMYVGDAILQGYMKARIVEEGTELNEVDHENVFTINNTEVVIIRPTAAEDQ